MQRCGAAVAPSWLTLVRLVSEDVNRQRLGIRRRGAVLVRKPRLNHSQSSRRHSYREPPIVSQIRTGHLNGGRRSRYRRSIRHGVGDLSPTANGC